MSTHPMSTHPMSTHPTEPQLIAGNTDKLYRLMERVMDQASNGPAMPVVAARGTVFIGIDVMHDGIKITLWRGREKNAVYRTLDKAAALAKALPQVIDEAMELARQEAGTPVPGEFVTE